MTDETTPDAVELLHEWAAIADSESIGRLEMVRVALLAERARHAEEVARLENDAAMAASRLRCVAQSLRDIVEGPNDGPLSAEDYVERLTAQLSSLRSQLRKVEGERDAARVQLKNLIENAASTRAVERAERAEVDLTSLRSLLPDVRACAEWVDDRARSGSSVLEHARNILAALDSQGGEGE